MRLIILALPGCDRPADYEALKAYLLQHIPTKPSELVTVVPKGLPGGQFVERLGSEFGIATTCVRGGVAQFEGASEGHLGNATFIGFGDAVTYAMDEPGATAVVVGDRPSESALRFRQVCQTYEVPCHFVKVEPTGLWVDTPARDVTSVTQVIQTPQIAAPVQEPYIFPQSHSSLGVFETCPRQYEAKYITKEVKFVQGPEAKWGDDVHVQLENYLKSGGTSVIPANMAMYKPFGDWVLNRAAQNGGQVLAERMLGVTKDLQPCAYRDKARWMGAKIDVTILYPHKRLAEIFDWKGLALDTPLPCPSGWTTMGSVAIGDALYDRAGAVCRVVGKSAVKRLPCYEVVFDDKSSVVCDEEHLWLTTDGRVVNVTELTTRDRVPLTHPVCGAAQTYLDPYVLGLWLADGKRTSGEISKPADSGVWAEVERRGFQLGVDTGRQACAQRTVLGIRGKLAGLGVLGNKHVPQAYLRAPVEVRLDLLRGMMDGDGYANPKRKQAVLQLTDEHMARQFAELALSLGERVAVHRVTGNGFGKEVVSWQVAWRPIQFNPFIDPRKADVIQATMGSSRDSMGRLWTARNYRRVTGVVRVDSVPTQCIRVDSPDHTFLCTTNWIPTHNTGKMKDDRTQLQQYAAQTLSNHPEIDTVGSGYIWLKDQVISPPVYYMRQDLASHWDTFQHKYAQLRDAYIRGVFPPRPNGLCGWCDVVSCEHNTKPKRRR